MLKRKTNSSGRGNMKRGEHLVSQNVEMLWVLHLEMASTDFSLAFRIYVYFFFTIKVRT